MNGTYLAIIGPSISKVIGESGKYVKGMLLQIEKVSFLTAFIFSFFLYQHFTGIYIHGLKSPVYVYQIHISRFENKEQHRYWRCVSSALDLRFTKSYHKRKDSGFI